MRTVKKVVSVEFGVSVPANFSHERLQEVQKEIAIILSELTLSEKVAERLEDMPRMWTLHSRIRETDVMEDN